MLQVYIFFLVLCGGLAAVSVLGDFMDAELGDMDTDLDFDADAEVDADLDLDAGEPDAEAGAEKILSLRGLMYTLMGFGLTGTALSLTGADPAGTVTLATSAGAGLASGWAVTRLVGWLRTSGSGERAPDSSFEGRLGRMRLPMGEASTGRVRIRRGERTYDLKALPHPSAGTDPDPASWIRVMVVEVRDGVARVIPADDDEEELLGP